jgi:hypothetical protein
LKTPYDSLPFIPRIIAETIVNSPCSGRHATINEPLRLALTEEQKKQFCDESDERCAGAYASKFDWFMECVKAKGNKGRDTLHEFVNHWLDSYLSSLNK